MKITIFIILLILLVQVHTHTYIQGYPSRTCYFTHLLLPYTDAPSPGPPARYRTKRNLGHLPQVHLCVQLWCGCEPHSCGDLPDGGGGAGESSGSRPATEGASSSFPCACPPPSKHRLWDPTWISACTEWSSELRLATGEWSWGQGEHLNKSSLLRAEAW